MSEQQPPGMREPTEEELRQYLGEMRQAHVGEIVAQVVSALLNGAQVKLGRRDARLLIDLAGAVNDQAGPYLEERFEQEVTQVLSQLRMAQVEAEQELAQLRATGQAPAEANDVGPEGSGAPAGDVSATDGAEGEDQGASQGQQRPAPPPSAPPQPGKRLWTPGG